MKKSKLLLILGLTAVLSGCGSSGSSSSSATSESSSSSATSSSATSSSSEAKLEDTLNILAGCEEPYMNAVADAFAKKYNVKVNAIRKSSGEIQTQVENEKGNPSADVLFGGTTDPYNALKTEGLLTKYTSANDSLISDAHFKDADHYWYGIYKGILGFMWNKDKLTELGLTAPQTWDDLIKPEYSKYITWSHPSTAGTAKLVVNTIVQKKANGKKVKYTNSDGDELECYDDSAAMEWFKQLDANTAKYTKSGSGASKEVGVGTTVIGIGFLHDVIYQIVDKGYTNIGMAAPSDGTSYEVGATAILKGADHPNLAQKFIDFATSAECVELAAQNGSYQFLVVDGAKQPQAAIDAGIDKIVTMDYDFDDAKTNIGHYVEDFNTAVKAEIPTA